MTSLDPRTQRVIRDLAKTQHDLKRQVARLNRGQDAGRTTIHHGALQVADSDGKVTHKLGQKGLDPVAGPVPPRPAAPAVMPGQANATIVVATDGDDFEGNSAPDDWAKTRIYATTQPPLEAVPGNAKGVLNELVDETTIGVHAGIWHVGIVWVTESGQVSEMSEVVEVEVEPPVDAQDIQDTLDTAQARLDEYRDNVAAPRFQALETGLSENADNLADARARLSAAESTLAPLPGQVQEARDFASGAIEAAESAEARAVEASNNASNRLQNGGFELGLDHWTVDNVTLSDDAHTGNQAALIGSGGLLMPDASIPVSEGDVWDVSAFTKNGTALVIEALNAADDTVLETFTTETTSAWSETGRLRLEIPAGVEYLNIRVTGNNILVDDIVLRDVTDVVRLERAATAARQTAEEAISRAEALELALDGEGGLKDRLQSAESTLQDKADTTALNQLDQKLSTNLAAFESHYSRIWPRSETPPPSGTHYAWLGEPHASVSVRFDGDGNETARNLIPDPQFRGDLSGALIRGEYEVSDGWLRLETAGIVPYFGASIAVTPGEFAALRFAMRWGQGIGRFRIQFQFRNSSGGSVSNAQIAIDYSDMPHEGDMQFTHLVPNTATEVRAYVWLYQEGGWIQPEDGAHAFMSRWRFATADSEEAALSQIEHYFDGSTESDRAHDLWYNTDGVPHEWANGTNGEPGGWVAISDERIEQLSQAVNDHADRLETAESDLETALEGPIDHERLRVGEGAFDEAFARKLITEHATIINAAMRNLSVEEKLLFAEAIGEQIWAELGVFDRLDAREGWVGNVALENGAVTAEKITATREMVTKIMGAEWAYIAEQLVVDGSILTRDLEALSAAIQSLTVTQRADIAELWAEELWTALAVIEELQAEEAWITSAMIEELTAEKVTVTQEFVGRVAELLHLVVDRIDANQLWADQTWQNAGYFGSEDADQSTLVDGTGLRITKHDHDNGASTDIVRLGGAGIGLTFTDAETGKVTGSQTPEGDASYRDVSMNSLTLAGTPLLPPGNIEVHNNNLWDAQPKGLVCFHESDMSGVRADHEYYGFIEVSHDVRADRLYRLTTNNFIVYSTGEHYGYFFYTLGDNPPAPHTESPQLGNAWVIRNNNSGSVQQRGDHTFQPDHDGTMRILLAVRNFGGDYVQFNSSSAYSTVQLRMEDLGPARAYSGMSRNAGHGGTAGTVRDNRPLESAVTTTWEATWYQNYSHGGTRQQTTHESERGYGSAGPAQGFRNIGSTANMGIWTSLFGFTTATNGPDEGLTLLAALDGATIHSIILEITGGDSYDPIGFTRYNFHAHGYTTPPSQYTAATGNHIETVDIRPGQRARIQLTLDQFAALLKTGDLNTVGIQTASTSATYAGWLNWQQQRPRLIITYTKG